MTIGRPWLTSIGFAIPKIAFYHHVYFRSWRRRNQGSVNRLGISIVWTSYRRTEVN